MNPTKLFWRMVARIDALLSAPADVSSMRHKLDVIDARLDAVEMRTLTDYRLPRQCDCSQATCCGSDADDGNNADV